MSRKAFLITGGTRGIGLATARRLAEEHGGLLILGYASDDEQAQAARQALADTGADVLLARYNLADPEAVTALADDVRASADGLDGIVHCAAIGTFKPILALRSNQWDFTLNVNARSFLLLVRELAPWLERRKGAAVALSSAGARQVLPGYAAVGIGKAALETTARYLAAELAPRGVRVNVAVAGLTRTRVVDALRQQGIDVDAAARASLPGRMAEPTEIAAAVAFLLSADAAWITGHALVVDGGAALSGQTW